MNCKYCNAPLEEGAAFCTNCGAKVEPAEQPAQPQQPAYQQMPPQGQYNAVPPMQGQYQSAMQPQPKKKSTGKTIGIIIGILVVLIVIIIAVSGKSDADKIVGVWHGTIDYSEYYENYVLTEDDVELINEYLPDASFDMDIEYEFVFNEDGTFYANVTEESYNAFVDSMVDTFRQAVINYARSLYPEATADLTDDELLETIDFASTEAMLRDDYGVTMEEVNDFDSISDYYVEDGVITFTESAAYGGGNYNADYTLNGDLLTITFADDPENDLDNYYQNLQFVRIDSVG